MWVYFASAIQHEADMERQFLKTGKCGWFVEIKCEK
jgi:hypothetical protein